MSLGAAVAALAVVLALGASPALAFGGTPKITPAAQDPQARAILFKMADFLAKAPAFSVTMRSGYDAIQADGQRIELAEGAGSCCNAPTGFVSRPNAATAIAG